MKTIRVSRQVVTKSRGHHNPPKSSYDPGFERLNQLGWSLLNLVLWTKPSCWGWSWHWNILAWRWVCTWENETGHLSRGEGETSSCPSSTSRLEVLRKRQQRNGGREGGIRVLEIDNRFRYSRQVVWTAVRCGQREEGLLVRKMWNWVLLCHLRMQSK